MTAAPDVLVERAVAETGLSDFGPDGWQAGLGRLLAAAEVDMADDPAARGTTVEMALRRLVNRLRIEEYYRAHGTGPPPPLSGLLVIVGLPRTATTALHHLLAVDTQWRVPRQWEIGAPVPPPDIDAEEHDERRAAAVTRAGDVRHISSVDGPTEDGMIHALDFGHQELALPVPTYTRWWRTTDLSSTFAYQERLLRLLHWRRPPHRWLVKAPAYLFHLPEMARNYPDARFVMTHRNPAAALPSASSVVLDARRMYATPAPDAAVRLGPELVEHFAHGVTLAVEARAEVGQDRFLDVGQKEVEDDPIGTVERIYAFAGRELTGPVRTAMAEWSAANRRGSRGEHSYTAEEFGLSTDCITEAFGPYMERYAAYLG